MALAVNPVGSTMRINNEGICMSIEVTQSLEERPHPIRVKIDQVMDQKFTIKAAIELRRKLQTAISDYQVAESIESED